MAGKWIRAIWQRMKDEWLEYKIAAAHHESLYLDDPVEREEARAEYNGLCRNRSAAQVKRILERDT